MNILVTGSYGFIGSHVVAELQKQGHNLSFIDIQYDIELGLREISADMDIRNPGFVQAQYDGIRRFFGGGDCIDACVHLAAIASPNQCKDDPSLAWETNVRGTYNVLNLLHRIGTRRIVFASTAHVYGVSPLYLPTTERHPLALQDCYTTTKIAGEELCELFWQNHGISYAALRFFNCYGPRQNDEYFVGAKLKQARAGGPVTLRNGDITKDFVSVHDVADAVVRALASDYVGPLNVGTGKETNLRTIAERIARGFGTELVPEDYVDGGPTRMCADIRRTESVLGWRPKVTIEDGIDELIAMAKEAA